MTPEAADFLVKARNDLGDARKIMGIPLATAAARTAYYAAFHAAEALIFEHTGKIAKTHSGVWTEFARILQALGDDRALLTFLTNSYKHKETSDYGTGENAFVSDEEAADAIVGAENFVATVASWLERGSKP